MLRKQMKRSPAVVMGLALALVMAMVVLGWRIPSFDPLMRLSMMVVIWASVIYSFKHAQVDFLAKVKRDSAQGKSVNYYQQPTLAQVAISALYGVPTAFLIVLCVIWNDISADPGPLDWLPFIKKCTIVDLFAFAATCPLFYYQVLEMRNNNPVAVSWKVRLRTMAVTGIVLPLLVLILAPTIWRDV